MRALGCWASSVVLPVFGSPNIRTLDCETPVLRPCLVVGSGMRLPRIDLIDSVARGPVPELNSPIQECEYSPMSDEPPGLGRPSSQQRLASGGSSVAGDVRSKLETQCLQETGKLGRLLDPLV